LLTCEAALRSRVGFESFVAYRRAAIDAHAIDAGRDPALGRLDITQLSDIARNLCVGDITQKGGDGLIAGISRAAQKVGIALAADTGEAFADLVPQAVLAFIHDRGETLDFGLYQCIHEITLSPH
jgi:hypothetical protein